MRSVMYTVEHNIGNAHPFKWHTSQVFKSRLAALAWARTDATGRWRVIRLEMHRIAIAKGGSAA